MNTSIEPQTPNTKHPDMVRFEMCEQVAFTDRKGRTDGDDGGLVAADTPAS